MIYQVKCRSSIVNGPRRGRGTVGYEYVVENEDGLSSLLDHIWNCEGKNIVIEINGIKKRLLTWSGDLYARKMGWQA